MKHAPAALTLAALLSVGCGDSDRTYSIEEVREDRAPEIQRGRGRNDLQRLGLEKRPNANPHGANPHGGDPHGGAMGGAKPGAPAIAYDLPDGWKELPPKQFRDANFTLQRDPSVECFLTIMGGSGGGLQGNIVRWRGQMGLEAPTDDEIARLPKIKLFGADATLIEMTGTYTGRRGGPKENYGFLGAFMEVPGAALTLKMTGPAEAVTQEKDNFIKLAASFRRNQAHGGHGHGATRKPDAGSDGIGAGMATGKSGFSWEVPAGWTKGPEKGMRVVTMHPGGNKMAACYVAMMAGDAGGRDNNVNRWFDEIGMPPLKPAEVEKLERVAMLGGEGVLVEGYGDFSGTGAPPQKDAGLLGVVCILQGRAVFVKFIGPRELVKREKDNFLAFAGSLKQGK